LSVMTLIVTVASESVSSLGRGGTLLAAEVQMESLHLLLRRTDA
jgi:hypothetical protein